MNFASSLVTLVEEHVRLSQSVPYRTNSPKNRETPGNLAPLKAFLVNLVSITNCGLLDWLLDIAADSSRHPTTSFWKAGLLEDPLQIISTVDSVETV